MEMERKRRVGKDREGWVKKKDEFEGKEKGWEG